ncbi:MAG: hypothetical protein SFU86_22565 [Pirellulaceae bacterium]|nr:hypothetical protein [Pirellulaceae bacterium]
MTLLTLGKYLIGDRQAILQIAGSRQALGLGLIFVLAAGFAREYDGEDLLHEPWHLLLPLGASLVSSAVLYLLVRLVAWLRGAKEPGLVSGYLDFLGLYLLTAPLAFVYAIPVEHFLSAGDAMRANLLLLALVSLWRVLLITRVVAVLYGTSFWSAIWVVLLFADTVAQILVYLTPVPIIVVMGGIRLSPSEQILRNSAFLVGFFGVLAWPAWLIGTIAVAFPRQLRWQYQATMVASWPVARQTWVVAGVCLAMWGLVLPFTQPAQILRRQVERDLKSGRIREALATMSAHEQSDFPPHWDPPPRMAYREFAPDPVDVQEQLDMLAVKPWVYEIFLDKFANSLRGRHYHFGTWAILSPAEVERRVAIIERMRERGELVRDQQRGLEQALRPDVPDELQKRIKALLEQTGREESAQD